MTAVHIFLCWLIANQLVALWAYRLHSNSTVAATTTAPNIQSSSRII